MIIITHFPSLGSFLGPLSTKDGKPLGPKRFKEIVKERYLISKNLNTSYNEVGQITPIEREYLLEFLNDEAKRSQDLIDKQRNKKK